MFIARWFEYAFAWEEFHLGVWEAYLICMGHSVQHQMESNGVFPFLLCTKQVGDVLQVILSQSCCTLCLYWDCKVSVQNKRWMCMESYLGSCFGSSSVCKWAGSCLRENCSSLKKEIICWHLFMSTRIHFKTLIVGRGSNLKASSFLKVAFPNGQLRLLCKNSDWI